MEILEKSAIRKAASILKEGGIVAFPTETVYGVGCALSSKEGLERLLKAKGHRDNKPFSLMFSNINDIFEYVDADLRTRLLIDRFLPGELTMLMRAKKGVPYAADCGTGVIGVRLSEDPDVRAMIEAVGEPCLVTSANRSGERAPSLFEDAINAIEADAIVKGECTSYIPSTIIDVTKTNEIKLVREGKLKFSDIESSFHKKIYIVLGSDHAGFEVKEKLKESLSNNGLCVIDVGCSSIESCDYPLFAIEAAKYISRGEADYGVLVCASGEGIAIAANKVKGVRCGIGYNDDVAHLIREHNRANMIAFGAKFMSYEDIERRMYVFLSSHFLRGKHARRVNEITDYENQ